MIKKILNLIEFVITAVYNCVKEIIDTEKRNKR